MAKKIIACIVAGIMLLLNIGSFTLTTLADDPVPNAAVVIASAYVDAVSSLASGDTFKGTVTVANISSSRIEKVDVSSSTSSSDVVIRSFSTQSVVMLEPGQSSTVYFTYEVASGSKGGDVEIRFTALVDSKEQALTQTTVSVMGEIEIPEYEPYFEVLSSMAPSTISTTTTDFKIGIRFAVRSYAVNNVKVTWTASSADTFEPKSAQTKSYGMMQANSNEYLEFEIRPSANIKPGSHTITINITGTGNVKCDYEVGIYVEKGAEDNGTGIKVLSTSVPDSAKTGDKFQIKSVLQNTGATVKNITVTLKTPDGIANNSLSILKISSFERFEEKEIVFDLLVTEAATENYNLFEMIVEYDGQSASHYTGLNIIVDKSQDIKVLSTAIPESAKKGSSFQIKPTIINEGSNEVKNISVTLKSPTGIMNSSSNIVQIDSLLKGGKKEIVFDLLVSDTAAENYNLFELEISHDGITKSQYVGLNITSDGKPADIIITPDVAKEVKFNTDFKLSFTVKNSGGDAKDLFISVPNPTGVVNKTVNTFLVPLLKSGESITREITFSAKEEVAGKYCLFQITVSSKASDGTDIVLATQYTGTAVDNIDEKTEFHPNLSIDYIDIPYSAGIDYDFGVELKLTNSGAEAKNVTITLEPQQGLINKTSNTVKIDSLQEGESSTANFTFMATESALNGFNSINIKISYSYKRADGTTAVGEDITQYSGLIVVNPKKADDDTSPDNKLDIPVVIISRFNYGGEEVYGGKSFMFELDFQNTHGSMAVKDLKITLSQDKGIFAPKSGSNTFFIEHLGAGQSITKSIEMIVKTDATPDSYGLTVALSYKNEKGEAADATEIINIPVQQETRFHIGEIPYINDIMMGEDAYVNIQFGNLGKSVIYNVVVKIESDGFYDPDGGYFAGNLEAGKSASKAFYLTPSMAGMLTGKVVFEYENAIGEKLRDEVDISFTVMDDGSEGSFDSSGMLMPAGDMEISYGEDGRPIMAMDDGNLEEENKGFFKWLFTDMGFLQWTIIIGAMLVVVALIVILVIVIRRKRNEITDDDDDL